MALFDEELEHQLESGALALEQRRDGDQGLHERRCERIDLPEHPAVAAAREQGGQDLFAYPCGPLERELQLRPRFRALRAQHPMLHDLRQVAVFERDGVEPSLPMVEHVGEIELSGAMQVRADQLAQVTLSRDEAHDRNRPDG